MPTDNQDPRTVLSADATQLIQRVVPDQEPATLDLPHARFGGYERTAVEQYVARLNTLYATAQQSNDELSGAIGRLQLESGRLRQRVSDLTEQNKRLAHEAENPMETLGRIAQDVINNAKGQADDIRAKVRAEERQRLKDSREKADKLVADAHSQADELVQQGADQKERLEHEAATILAKAREQAKTILSEANAKAESLDERSRRRAAQADQAGEDARRTVADAYRRLLSAAQTLTPGANTPVIDMPADDGDGKNGE